LRYHVDRVIAETSLASLRACVQCGDLFAAHFSEERCTKCRVQYNINKAEIVAVYPVKEESPHGRRPGRPRRIRPGADR
jgi:hypothetical protein